MTFCRRGNDYADVAQPFRLTGRSHGAQGDTADAASSTGERRAATGLLHPPLPSPSPAPSFSSALLRSPSSFLVLHPASWWTTVKVSAQIPARYWLLNHKQSERNVNETNETNLNSVGIMIIWLVEISRQTSSSWLLLETEHVSFSWRGAISYFLLLFLKNAQWHEQLPEILMYDSVNVV